MSIAQYRRIDADEALRYIFSAYDRERPYSLFDSRDVDSFARGRIPTAELLLESEVGNWLHKLPRAHPVLIYCYHGNSSQTFAKRFAESGFSEVYSVDGGFHALVHALHHARERAARATQG